MNEMTDARWSAADLRSYGEALLTAAGLEPEKAATVAEILVEGDLLGHTTHGLQLLAPYLREIEAGRMALTGRPEVVSDRPAALTWDGRFLPGPWLVVEAFEEAARRAKDYGQASIVIRRSHHIACLAAYLLRATEKGLALVIMSSDPSSGSVSPFGGLRGVMTPNPLAAGYPTSEGPILIDVSMSITTNGLTGRLHSQGKKLSHAWLKDAEGRPSDDPAVLFTDPPGSIMPIGGLDHGHKGYGLGLMVEAMTSGLGGLGRSDPPKQWGAAVHLQVFDPEAFGGRDSFVNELGWLVRACRDNPVPAGAPPVRIPGERGLKLREVYRRDGVPLPAAVPETLAEWAEKLAIATPQPI